MSGDLCDHVLGRDGSAARLEQLSRTSPFLIPLGGDGSWFRVHGVLTLMLTARLRDRDRERFTTMQRRASHYIERSGDIDRAIDHARRGRDEPHHERLIVDHAGDALLRGRAQHVSAWIDALDPHRIAEDPSLQLIVAITRFHAGDVADARRWIRRLAESAPLGRDPHGCTLRYHAVRAVIDNAPPEELMAGACAARGQLPVGWRMWADWGIASNHIRVGALDAAAHAFESAAFEARLAGYHSAEAMLLAGAAAAAHFSDDQAGAAMLSSQATARLDAGGEADAPMSSIVVAMSGLIAALRGRHRDAVEMVAQARRQLTDAATAIPAITMLAHYVLADACLRLGEGESAVANLRMGDQRLIEDGSGRGAEACIGALRMRVAAAKAAATCPSSVLSPAELRVVPFLATNLSLADIANQLYVSRHTVKSHATAIYRKLGVDSRSRAVEVAREVGLLGRHEVDLPTHHDTPGGQP